MIEAEKRAIWVYVFCNHFSDGRDLYRPYFRLFQYVKQELRSLCNLDWNMLVGSFGREHCMDTFPKSIPCLA